MDWEKGSSLTLKEIDSYLTSHFGEEWKGYELETLSLELGKVFSPIARDKISIIKVLRVHPNIFFDNLLFFLHATNVINGNEADFNFIPWVGSLEVALAIREVESLVGAHDFKEEVIKVINKVLNDEGYSVAPPPFDTLKGLVLAPGQTAEDIKNKATAINLYLKAWNL